MIKTLILLSCMVVAPFIGAHAADDATKAAPDRSKLVERHEKMSELHKTAAACLKAGKPIVECHDAMMKDSQMMHPGDCPMGDGCPMRGHKGMHGGKKGKGMRAAPSETHEHEEND